MTVSLSTLAKSGSEFSAVISTIISNWMSPSISESSAGVTVIDCGTFQFSGVNVNVWIDIEASSEMFAFSNWFSTGITSCGCVIVISTLLVGCALRTIANVSSVPSSETTVSPPVWMTVKPAMSSSMVSTGMTVLARPSKSSSVVCGSIAIVMSEFWSPSIRNSLNAVTVIS